MRREKPSPPPVHDTCNFARSGSRVPREFRARCGIIKELPELYAREDSGQVFAAWIYIAADVEDSAPILRGGGTECEMELASRFVMGRKKERKQSLQ